MRRKIGSFVGIILIGALVWYLFLKPHDYVVRFESKASPGTINQTLKFWADQLEDAQLLQQENLSDFKYRIRFNDATYTYHWKIEKLNDSVSKIKAYVTDSTYSLRNRITLPFSETDFEKRTKNTVKDALQILQEHLDSFKVTLVGEGETPAKYCACIPLKSKQRAKVIGMMDYYSFLSSFIAENKITLDGRPLVEVEDWNMENDSISYNFCFPITKTDSLPQREGIQYKQLKRQKALHAIYNGNYVTSDRAWYTLIDHAEKNNISIKKIPLEIFHSNPNMGGNELEWKTDVFMPIQE